MDYTVPVRTGLSPESGVGYHWSANHKFLLVTLGETTDTRAVLAVLSTRAVGLELVAVSEEIGGMLFRMPSPLAWRSVVDTL
jgi:hypothetical protein